ncbi:DNA-directed RNA polymerase III subunit C31 [Coniosporium apollinis]|uniref:DNA-directed RNA polymerase III subunit n=2 Tax=Coniosporium TaxID=2810619 RepID=A0ABQ9P0Q3_9PEZI|nr:DNA-directed RNA polymerase III subunit C31 [Cladosporium sp. JES 115]KAJ9667977.1 DNA-directed RNA polymerase III subunit C31 [Coniosporium apollinis]
MEPPAYFEYQRRLTHDQQIPPPIAKPPRRLERIQVAHYRALRERIHEGPLYTVLGDNVRVGKTGSSAPSAAAAAAATFDPFEGMPTYTQKYKKQRRKIPRLDMRPYVKRFFPEELHTTLDPLQAGKTAKPKKKLLQIANSNRLRKLDEFEDPDVANEGDDEEKDPEDEENENEQDQDDAFDEDDEDDNDDYNAEQYFDGGEDDDYGDDGGGGGDEYGDF